MYSNTNRARSVEPPSPCGGNAVNTVSDTVTRTTEPSTATAQVAFARYGPEPPSSYKSNGEIASTVAATSKSVNTSDDEPNTTARTGTASPSKSVPPNKPNNADNPCGLKRCVTPHPPEPHASHAGAPPHHHADAAPVDSNEDQPTPDKHEARPGHHHPQPTPTHGPPTKSPTPPEPPCKPPRKPHHDDANGTQSNDSHQPPQQHGHDDAQTTTSEGTDAAPRSTPPTSAPQYAPLE